MADYYILDKDKKAVPCDLQTWAQMFEDIWQRIVTKTKIDDVEVSTVFLGSNHNYGDKVAPPLIFESMIFGGPMDQHQDRYSTWEEAKIGHWELVGKIIEEPMHKIGVSVSVVEKHNVGITYYTVGYGTCKEYHTSLLELYYKMYENAPRAYLLEENPAPDNTHYDICVEGSEKDLELTIQRLTDLALIYSFDKWKETHREEHDDS